MVEYELDGHIAVITIKRPEARNAVNTDVAQGMEAAIDRLEEDPEAWIGIVTGGRTDKGWIFCAGADLKQMAVDPGGMSTPRGGFAGFVQRERTKPVIAAVDGPALAFGGAEFGLPGFRRARWRDAAPGPRLRCGGEHLDLGRPRVPRGIVRAVALRCPRRRSGRFCRQLRFQEVQWVLHSLPILQNKYTILYQSRGKTPSQRHPLTGNSANADLKASTFRQHIHRSCLVWRADTLPADR